MLKVKPFQALRPLPDFSAEVSCLPYDVMNTKEAAAMAEGKANSYLHIIRSEIDLSEDIDAHAPEVYEKAAENLQDFIARGILKQDEKPLFYIYRQIMNGRVQTGICALVSVDDYKNGLIKKHEFTMPQKEQDRIENFLACRAHTEPVFLINKSDPAVKAIIHEVTQKAPVYDFVSEDAITHTLWLVDSDEDISALEKAFGSMDALYIADGHHRTASSCRVGDIMREQNPGYDPQDQFNFIMAVIFSEEELWIMDYNRLLKDLGTYDEASFIEKLKEDFTVTTAAADHYKTDAKHTFSMYIGGQWYLLTAIEGSFEANDPVLSLDAAILQNNVFNKLLGIQDPRTTDRLSFVGGIRGYEELMKKVDSGEAKAAFGLYPVSIGDLISVADSGMVMPPKSTWFEPKLRSGLFIHQF